jgi:glycosyltransferase involved in cell wall biosynthesis
VLSVGALHPVKAQDLIIRGVSTLTERPTVNFIFNSDSMGTQARLTALAENLRVPVSFNRLVEDSDLVAAYSRTALVAFPSCLEPFGFVPLEAMACGAAVVGVAEGGTRETVLHGVTGLLTDRSPEAFGRAIGTLLADDRLRDTMGKAGRRHVSEHWTWEQASAELEANLQRVMSRGTAGGGA